MPHSFSDVTHIGYLESQEWTWNKHSTENMKSCVCWLREGGNHYFKDVRTLQECSSSSPSEKSHGGPSVIHLAVRWAACKQHVRYTLYSWEELAILSWKALEWVAIGEIKDLQDTWIGWNLLDTASMPAWSRYAEAQLSVPLTQSRAQGSNSL